MNRILVGLDGSPRAASVIAAAAGLAAKTGAKLVLFRAIGVQHDLPPEVYSMSPKDLEARLETHARQALEKLGESVSRDLVVGIKVHLGVPWDAICRAAREENVDAILIGSHGYDPIDRLIGTTAAKVVNHADRTVIVVRAPEKL